MAGNDEGKRLDRKRIELILRQKINTDYGQRTIGHPVSIRRMEIGRYSTGSMMFDFALGGGIPVERSTLLWGDKGSGKTNTALMVCADAQRRCANCLRVIPDLAVEEVQVEDGTVEYYATGTCDCYRCGLFRPTPCAKEKPEEYKARLKSYEANSFDETIVVYLDAEKTLDFQWAQLLGVDPRRLLHMLPSNTQEAFDAYVQYLNSGVVDLLILDSLAALSPIEEIAASSTEWQTGLAAKLTNKMMRTSTAASIGIAKDRNRAPTQLWINQIRQKIGVTYGDPSTLPGGMGQLFSPSVIVKMWSSFTQKDNARELFGDRKDAKMLIAQSCVQCFKVVKNKTFAPGGEGRFELIVSGPNKGQVEEFGYLMYLAERFGFYRKDGKKFHLGDQEFRTQRDAFEMARTPAVLCTLRAKIFEKMREELDR